MLIDWFTVAAQIVNFLVLVALLKRFLYGRIITAMDQREEKIASQLEEAAKKKKEAEQEVETYRRTNRELDEKKEEMLFQVKEEVELKRKELMKRAHGKVDQIQARWHEAIQREKDAFLQDLRQRTGKQVYTIARRALTDLANAHLEQRMVEAFVERIAKLDEKKQKAILASTQRGDHGVVINSAFEIPTNARQKITKVVRNHIGDAIDIRYQISPDMILGIELKTHGHKIAWSIDDYLDSLEESVSEALSGEMEDRSIGRRADEKVQLKHPRKPKQKRGKR